MEAVTESFEHLDLLCPVSREEGKQAANEVWLDGRGTATERCLVTGASYFPLGEAQGTA